VSLDQTGEIEWRCSPIQSSALLVELKKSGGGWETRVNTVTKGTLRAKGRSAFWETFASRDNALVKLKSIFEQL
jgi:hypothetical protein